MHLRVLPAFAASSVPKNPIRDVEIGDYRVDADFAAHFKNLHQVFMYITNRCNLECEQCIYKPSITHFINEEIQLDDALALLRTFHSLGAGKVTFLGGEPTVYGHRANGQPLLDLIEGTASIGYDYIRLERVMHFGSNLLVARA